jgi:DNA-binding beta-propeller fold protein YncE
LKRVLGAVAASPVALLGTFATPALATSPPDVTAAFANTQIPLGRTTTLSITIGNPNPDVELTGLGITVQLPRQVAFAQDVNLVNSCGGTVSYPYADTLDLTGGTVERDQLCEVSFDVTATWSGKGAIWLQVGSDEGDINEDTAGITVSAPAAAPRVYWSYAPVSYANLDGSGGGDLPVDGASAGDSDGVALDPAAGRIYWANTLQNKISYANLDGSGGGDVYTGSATVNYPTGVALDHAAGRIYWANSGANQISYANLDGTGGGVLNTGSATIAAPWGVAIDPGRGRIYWVNAQGPQPISYANLDGSGGGDLPSNGALAENAIGIALDLARGRVYWANQGAGYGGSISYADLDGSGGGNVPLPTQMTSHPVGLSVDPDAGRVYWVEFGTSTIYSANLDGSDPRTLATISLAGATFPALLEPPAPASAPTISGGTEPGAMLTCSAGVWKPDLPGSSYYRAPHQLAYQWTRDGAAIAGATGPQLSARTPGIYSCTVTATNAAGSTSSQSPAHSVEVPDGRGISGFGHQGTSSAPVCAITAASNRVLLPATNKRHRRRHKALARGSVRFAVHCNQPVSLILTGKVISRLSARHNKRGKRVRLFRLRRVRGAASAGIRQVLTIKLPARAIAQLAHGVNEGVAVKLMGENANGTGSATALIRRLKPVAKPN